MAQVRAATPADMPRLVEMGARFHAASPWAEVVEFDADSFAILVSGLMSAGVVLAGPQSMAACCFAPMFFNRHVIVAQEVFWWAEDGQGRALRKAMEAEAKRRGAVAMIFGNLEGMRDTAVTRVLARAGYKPVEHLHLRRL